MLEVRTKHWKMFDIWTLVWEKKFKIASLMTLKIIKYVIFNLFDELIWQNNQISSVVYCVFENGKHGDYFSIAN